MNLEYLAGWILYLSPPPLLIGMSVLNAVLFIYRYIKKYTIFDRVALLGVGLALASYAVSYVFVQLIEQPLIIGLQALFRLDFVLLLTALTVMNRLLLLDIVKSWIRHLSGFQSLLD